MAGARAGEQGTYTGARRASGRGEQWPHQGEKAELCRLQALGGAPGLGDIRLFPVLRLAPTSGLQAWAASVSLATLGTRMGRHAQLGKPSH